MKKNLFFDDNRLFGIDNLRRDYGKPEFLAEYDDGVCSADFFTGFIFKLDDGRYRLLYMGHGEGFKGMKLFSAESNDGINFLPEKLFADKEYPHEIMNIPRGDEIAFVYEDKYTKNPDERYKLLLSEHNNHRESLSIDDELYVSGDLINWTKKEGVLWGDGAEPVASVFYNKHRGVYTIVQRPFWGVRCVGYKETADWKNFSEFQMCLNVDSLDESLSEIYGMPTFEYDGMYIGFPLTYRNLKSEPNAKYKNGTIDCQLAYSYDGRYWQRSLRKPFMSGVDARANGLSDYKLFWTASMIKDDSENIIIYVSASEYEHGPAFGKPGTGKIFVYGMRKDGFIGLTSENKAEPSRLITREKVWFGGELHLNINAKNVTVAVFDSCESEHVGGNVLGFSVPVEGYGHEDCIPFSGDSTDLTIEYKNGKLLDDLKGKTLVFEIRFNDGTIYSVSGNYEDVFNTQAARYRKFGILP